jgi:hypothetical protein
MCYIERLGGVDAFLSSWFQGAPISSIGKEDVARLLAYAFFSART